MASRENLMISLRHSHVTFVAACSDDDGKQLQNTLPLLHSCFVAKVPALPNSINYKQMQQNKP